MLVVFPVAVTKAGLGDASYLQANQRLRTLLLSSPAWAVVHENFHRLIQLFNLQWLLQNRDRTDLKNPIEDLTIRVTCDHNNFEVRINLLGCFKNLITGSHCSYGAAGSLSAESKVA